MRYRIKMEFVCDDHRLRGKVEREIESPELWHSTLRQILESMQPLILAEYPYLADAIDYIETRQITIELL
jgi:hypothetical protein